MVQMLHTLKSLGMYPIEKNYQKLEVISRRFLDWLLVTVYLTSLFFLLNLNKTRSISASLPRHRCSALLLEPLSTFAHSKGM